MIKDESTHRWKNLWGFPIILNSRGNKNAACQSNHLLPGKLNLQVFIGTGFVTRKFMNPNIPKKKKNDCSLRYRVTSMSNGWGPGPVVTRLTYVQLRKLLTILCSPWNLGSQIQPLKAASLAKAPEEAKKQNYEAIFSEILNDIPISWNMIQYNTVQSNTIQYDII